VVDLSSAAGEKKHSDYYPLANDGSIKDVKWPPFVHENYFCVLGMGTEHEMVVISS
jgi:hypothetical protein